MASLHFTSPSAPLHYSTSSFTFSTHLTSKSISFSNNGGNGERIAETIFITNGKRASKLIQASSDWRTRVSFLPSFFTKGEDTERLKRDLLDAIAPLDRGAEATPEDQELINQIASKLEAVNKVKEPLTSFLLNGKWELLYTTSQSILQSQRPKFLRPNGKIYQAINVDTLRAQNMETWPFYNQATANLVPLNARRVAVKFDAFKIAGVIPIKSRGSGRGQIEITYLDE